MRRAAFAGNVILSLLLSLPLTGHANDEPVAQVPDALQAAVADTERIGRLLQRLDRAAWIATDVMLGDDSTRDLRGSVRGWITMPTDTGTRVSFFDDSDPARPVYMVDVDLTGRPAAQVASADATFDAAGQAMIRARRAAMSQSFLQCSRTYNTVVFPADDAIHVYLMPGTTQHGAFPVGGHHLFVYEVDGRTLRSRRAFTKSCLDLSEDGREGSAESLGVTHLLDPQPTEIHAFISMNTRMPFYVITERHAWKLDHGSVSLIDTRETEDEPVATPTTGDDTP